MWTPAGYDIRSLFRRTYKYRPVQATPFLSSLVTTRVGSNVPLTFDEFADLHHLVLADPPRYADAPPGRLHHLPPAYPVRVARPTQITAQTALLTNHGSYESWSFH